ncbi:hypothetical protein M885DRAFT_522649 [Pelagophyceae sp. CCMP2097]|nr:hypothetical protein M885DRAFT_522649 [Pelagophyceae sp. CCMP2097]
MRRYAAVALLCACCAKDVDLASLVLIRINGTAVNVTLDEAQYLPGNTNRNVEPISWKEAKTVRVPQHLCFAGSAELPEHLTCASLGWAAAPSGQRIFDAFAYNGEADVVEARRRELKGVVDGTAVVTTAVNFKGEARETRRLAQQLEELFKGDPLEHVDLGAGAFSACDALPSSQRTNRAECRLSIAKNGVALAVERFKPRPHDLVIFGDPDEIPARGAIELLRRCSPPLVSGSAVPGVATVLKLRSVAHYVYSTRCLVIESMWYSNRGPAVLLASTMRRYGLRAFQYNAHKKAADMATCAFGEYASCYSYDAALLHLNCAAWHLSSFGGAAALAEKLQDNKDRASVPTVQDVQQCREFNGRRGTMQIQRLQMPAKAYPQVPGAVSGDEERFSALFEPPTRAP